MVASTDRSVVVVDTSGDPEDPGKLEGQSTPPAKSWQGSAFKKLGLLDRYLVVWILLAMVVGIILGNFVPNTGPALQKGKFVGVSVPIGDSPNRRLCCYVLTCVQQSGYLS
jgi:ACR3 family arsenite transporter